MFDSIKAIVTSFTVNEHRRGSKTKQKVTSNRFGILLSDLAILMEGGVKGLLLETGLYTIS